jgi:restriction system protein
MPIEKPDNNNNDMNKNQLWMVKAGEGAFLKDDFINKSIVSIGWNETGDLSTIDKLDKIKGLLSSKYPEYKSGTVNISAGQIYRFVHEFKIGDAVMTYNPSERVYWIGEIDSEYRLQKSEVLTTLRRK